jgi:hypothetical protein
MAIERTKSITRLHCFQQTKRSEKVDNACQIIKLMSCAFLMQHVSIFCAGIVKSENAQGGISREILNHRQ